MVGFHFTLKGMLKDEDNINNKNSCEVWRVCVYVAGLWVLPGRGGCEQTALVLLPSQDPAWHEALTRTGCVGRRKIYPVPSLRGVVTPNLGVCFLPVGGIRATRPLFSGRKKEACILKLVALLLGSGGPSRDPGKSISGNSHSSPWNVR